MPHRKQTKQEEPALAPLDLVREHADALYRAAVECCHQHDRLARLLAKSQLESEEKAAAELCTACDDTLGRLADGYERAAAHVPGGREETWWHQANQLWLASREYARRHAGCDARQKRMGRHDREELGALHMEFELEASALLALRHACSEYAKARPQAA